MQISVSSQTTLLNISNFFVFALYDATAPTVVLESQQPAKPYGNPLQISFTYNCLAGHIYIIKLWESADSTPTGVVRNSFSQSVNENSVNIRMPIYLEAGLSAGFTAGATSYIDTSWINWDYWIIRNPNTMIPDSSGNTNANYHQDATGGFSLIQSGDTFQPGEQFQIHFIPQIITGSPAGTPSAKFSSGSIITADTTLTLSDSEKALLIQSATNKITITLPLISTIPDYTFFYFYSIGGSHINATIQAPGTDKFQFNILLSQIILGQSETLKIFKANGVWNVDNDLQGFNKVGELLYNYSLTELNTIAASGSLVSRATYPRLWAWVQGQLGGGVVVTDTAWTSTFITVEGINYYTKQGCFSTGDGSTTFRLPLISSYFLRPIDGIARVPGSFEVQTLQAHVHTLTPPTSQGATGQGKITTGNEASEPTQPVFTTDSYGSTETKPTNIGAYALIRF